MAVLYTRKIPIRQLTTDNDILDRINDLVFRTNNVVRETYQFLRLYFLWLLENNIELPTINRSLLKMIFTVISYRQNTSRNDCETKENIELFYNDIYSKLQRTKVQAPNKDILDYEITDIITNVENHIKGSFFTYINRLVYAIIPNDDKQPKEYNDTQKEQRKKLRNDLFDTTYTSDSQYHTYIDDFSTEIKENLKLVRSKKPQSCFPLLYKISLVIKLSGKKQLALIPLRRSLIPAYITIDATIFKEAFRDILKEQEIDIWKNITDNIYDTLGCKETFEFTSLKTDSIACSITFRAGERKQKPKKKFEEQYFEDLKSHIEFEGKKIVAIDPNKGNLVYCYDGENTLRRHRTKDDMLLVKINIKKSGKK